MTFVMVIQMSFMMELVNKTWRHLNVSMTLLRKTKKRLYIKLCHWFPKVPFFLKMAIFVNLEVPFFI